MEQFPKRIKAVDEELESQVKSSQVKAAELFESACLQNEMVFELDNKLISGFDAPSNSSSATVTRALSASIYLNPLAYSIAQKQKYKKSTADANQAFHNAMLLANCFKEFKTVLTQALPSKNQTHLLPTHVSKASSPISSLDDRILRMKSRLTEVQSGIDSWFMEVQSIMSSRLAEVQQNREACLGDVTCLLGRILVAVSTKESGEETQRSSLDRNRHD